MKQQHRLIILLAIVLAGVMSAQAQSRSSLRINEVMVQNDSSIVDDYGLHQPWIELFNANFSPLEISAIYITNDKNNPKKYPVPLGDVNTRIPKRQHVVFFADGDPNKGTFHTNFVLEPGKDNWIAIYDADGKTLIDSVTVPASLVANATYARAEDGKGDWSIRQGKDDKDYITPSSANIIKDTNPKVEDFKKMDRFGIGMAIMAMAIVFSALLLLCICFMIISKVAARIMRTNKAISQGIDPTTINSKDHDADSGEEIAAIVMALHEHLNAHDTESTILTINKVKRAYSPWSSKIYGLRELPRK